MNSINENNNMMVSYMIKSDGTGKTWEFPDNFEIWETNESQILSYNVKVQYFGKMTVKCSIVSDKLI